MNSYLLTVDEQVHEQLNLLIQQMSNAEGVIEELKAANQMEWVQRMNDIQNRAKEMIFFDWLSQVINKETARQGF